MIPSPALPWFELARFKRSRLTRAAIVAVLMVPLFYGAMYTWANLNPTGNLDKVDAAVVNHDQLIEVTGRDGTKQPVAVGRQLAGNLVSSTDSSNYNWILTDAADAQRGLADGTYKAVLTIPENLSKAATSTSGDPVDAIQGKLDLQTDDAVNYINGTIAQTILHAAKNALNAQVTETYLDNVYLSFSDIKLALDDAAKGAAKLGDGADALAGGAGELSDGAATLADGTRKLATGTKQLDDGAQKLSGGLDQLDDKTRPLAGQSQQLADGSRQVADGTKKLNSTVQDISSAILGATADADRDITALTRDLEELAQSCEDDPPAGFDCNLLRQAAEGSGDLKGFVSDIRGQTNEFSSGTQKLADGAEKVADGNAQLADGVPTLVKAIGDAAGGAQKLAGATGQLSDGAAQAAGGADRLADGSAKLVDGAEQLSAGALKLTNGLRDGSGQVPDYDKSEREKLATTAATPIQDAAERVHPVKNYGAALAPYFISLALWVGAMAIYLLLRPLSARAIASTTGSVRTALAGYLPGLVIAFTQVGLLLLVIEGIVGVEPASRWLMIGVCLMTAAVFTAVNQMFVALFGGAGRFAALVFVSLQLTAAGGTYPIETAPPFFGVIHDLLPMTYAVHGMRAALAGGTDGIVRDFVVLALFTLLALSITVLAARRQQTVTMKRLHPTLVV